MFEKNSVKLITQDKNEFDLSMKTAQVFPFVQTILSKNDSNSTEIVTLQLPSNIKGRVFTKILAWVERHKNESFQPIIPVPGVRPVNVTDVWDVDFLKIDQINLFEIVLAANQLDLPVLVDLCCKEIASKIQEKNSNEIRSNFNIRDDWDPEDRAAFRLENQWVFGGKFISKNPTQILAGLGIVRLDEATDHSFQ